MKKSVIGFLPGSLTGVGPEIMAKTLAPWKDEYVPVLIGDWRTIKEALSRYAPSFLAVVQPLEDKAEGPAYVDVPAENCPAGAFSAESGRASLLAMEKAAELLRAGVIHGILFGPECNGSLRLADPAMGDAAGLLEKAFGVPRCARLVKHSDVIRAHVVGPCAFRDIFDQITEEGILQTGEDLIEALRLFGLEKKGIVVSSLNPHRGDGGLFGDEEFTLDRIVQRFAGMHPDVPISGTFAPDSLLIRAVKGAAAGLLYLHINQGDISMTTWANGEQAVLYLGLPCPALSTEWGCQRELAGTGEADAENLRYSLEQLLLILKYNGGKNGVNREGVE